MRKFVLAALILLLAAGSTPGHAAQPTKLYAVLEDSGRTADPQIALEKMKMVHDAGFNAIITTVFWGPGVFHPWPKPLQDIKTLVAAAQKYDIQVILKVIHDWHDKANLHTPLRVSDQRQFAQLVAEYLYQVHEIRYVIVDNEVNSQYFWRPQFTPQGVARSPEDYVRLLAVTYDTAKIAAKDRGIPVTVIGGELASTGSDSPDSKKVGISPEKFILGMGKAMHEIGRRQPIMDVFSLHPYGVANGEPPEQHHEGGTIGFADYGKLRTALRKAFDKTAQLADLPLFYSEYGVETVVASSKSYLYEGVEKVNGVSYETQAGYYRFGTRLAACRSDIFGEAKFLAIDEPNRAGWQSGLYFVDASEKPSLEPVKQELLAAEAGNIDCR